MLRNRTALLLGFGLMLASPHAFAGPQENPKQSVTAQAPKATTQPVKQLPTTVTPDLRVGDTIDLNTATVAQFESLPGIGPVIAKRIWEYREQNGPFQRVDDLMLVNGIGKARYDNMFAYCAVHDDTIKAWQRTTTQN